jgi:hypothetical protein
MSRLQQKQNLHADSHAHKAAIHVSPWSAVPLTHSSAPFIIHKCVWRHIFHASDVMWYATHAVCYLRALPFYWAAMFNVARRCLTSHRSIFCCSRHVNPERCDVSVRGPQVHFDPEMAHTMIYRPPKCNTDIRGCSNEDSSFPHSKVRCSVVNAGWQLWFIVVLINTKIG